MFFLQFYFIFLLTIVSLWMIGWTIRKLLKIKQDIDYLSILYNTFTGILVFATLVAVFYTKGKTILVFNTVIGLFFYLSYKKYKKTNELKDSDKQIKKKDNKFIVLVNALIAATLIYTIFFVIYADGDNKVIYITSDPDYLFYSTVSYNLIYTGIENALTNYILPPSYLTPYHYLKLWLNGGIASITGLNHVSVLLLVTYPLFIFLIVIGMCFLFSYFTNLRQDYILPIIGILLTFVIALPPPHAILQWLYGIENYYFLPNPSVFYSMAGYSLWTYHKISVIHVFLILALVLLINKQKEYGYLILFSLPINYIPTMPAIYGGFILFMIYLFVLKHYSEFKWLFVRVFTLFFIIFLFYYFLSSPDSGDYMLIKSSSDSVIISIFHNLIHTALSKVTIIFSLQKIAVVLMYHWYLFVFAYLMRNKINHWFLEYPYLSLFFFIPFVGLIVWFLNWESYNSKQFFLTSYFPVFNLITVLALLNFYRVNRKISVLFFIILVIYGIYIAFQICFINTYKEQHSIENKQSVRIAKEKLSKLPNKTGVYFQDMRGISTNVWLPKLPFLGTILLYQNLFNDFYCIPLNMFEFNLDKMSPVGSRHLGVKYAYQLSKASIKHSVFNRYIEKQKQEHKFVSISQSQLDFIREYNVKYVIADTGYVLPPHIDSLVKERVNIYYGGYFLYLLK